MISSILTFFIVLSILVLVHEYGHFWMARRAGVKVEEFGFGIPPRLFGIQRGETLYSINLLPFGGFVKLHGENEIEKGDKEVDRAFMSKGKLARIGIIIAGVVMNFVLAVFCFGLTYSITGIPTETNNVKVIDITDTSPAKTYGLVVGDIIRMVDKNEVKSTEDFIKYVAEKKGKKITLTLDNGKKIQVTPRENPPANEGPLGVVISTSEVYFPPMWQRPFYGAYYGTREALFWGKNVLVGFGTLVTSLGQGNAPKDLAGPVGIYAITSQAAKMGILTLVNFVGILSINLAILNILPIPALDGGRLLFILIEGIFGKKVLPKIENTIHSIGFLLLLGLLILITISDVRKLISAGSIANFINGMLK